MERSKVKALPTNPPRSAREVMDDDYLIHGDDDGKIWTREELADHHRLGDLICEKLALGDTTEQINLEWQGKSTQEILAESEANPALTLQK